jgi:hypothetical protein
MALFVSPAETLVSQRAHLQATKVPVRSSVRSGRIWFLSRGCALYGTFLSNRQKPYYLRGLTGGAQNPVERYSPIHINRLTATGRLQVPLASRIAESGVGVPESAIHDAKHSCNPQECWGQNGVLEEP